LAGLDGAKKYEWDQEIPDRLLKKQHKKVHFVFDISRRYADK